MPSLKIWQRRWSFASDDLLLPACLFLLIHCLSVLCLAALLLVHLATLTADVVLTTPSSQCATLFISSAKNNASSTTTSVSSISETSFSLPATFCTFSYPILVSLCTIVLTCAFLLECSVAYFASQGTIMNPGPRERMMPFLGLRYLFVIVEILFVTYTFVWWNGCLCVQSSVLATVILALAIVETLVVLLLILFAICSFDFSGDKWYRLHKAVCVANAPTNRSSMPMRVGATSSSASTFSGTVSGERKKISRSKRRLVVARQAKEAYTRSWYKQFNLMFCCLGSERRAQQSTFFEVASLVGEVFGDSDLVVSDLIAGLILLRRAQKRVIQKSVSNRVVMMSGVPVELMVDEVDGVHIDESHGRFCKSLLDPEHCTADGQLLMRIARIFKFAHAATGWPFYVMRHPGFLVSATCGRCYCMGSSSPTANTRVVVHDNPCKLNLQAALKQTGISESDFIYGDFESGVEQTAFLVLLDPVLKAVVVSVRGTLSMSDILTDLNADSAKIPTLEISQQELDESRTKRPSSDGSWLAHKGMLTAAIALRDRLMNDGLLERAFRQADECYGGPSKKAGFTLALVGHSLGAGVASLLGILFRSDYPNLHVFAFSPPGGLLGLAAAKYSQSFVTTVILGKDVIPRIGVRQIEALRADIVNILKACNQPKWSVIGQAAACCCPQTRRNRELSTASNSSSSNFNNIDYNTIKTMRKSVGMHSEEGEEEESQSEQSNCDKNNNNDPGQQFSDLSPRHLAEPFVLNETVADSSMQTTNNANASSNQFGLHDGIRVRHHPLRLPGTIYHLVRRWKPADGSNADPKELARGGHIEFTVVKTSRSFYDHVLVSPRMLADHMPNGFMDALDELVKQHKLDMNALVALSTADESQK